MNKVQDWLNQNPWAWVVVIILGIWALITVIGLLQPDEGAPCHSLEVIDTPCHSLEVIDTRKGIYRGKDGFYIEVAPEGADRGHSGYCVPYDPYPQDEQDFGP